MQENWLPLGPVAIISAFNFPVAVWSWTPPSPSSAAIRVSGSPPKRPPSPHSPPKLCSTKSSPISPRHRRASAASSSVTSTKAISSSKTTHPPRQRHRQHAHGQHRRPEGRRPVRSLPPRARGNNAIIVTPSADSQHRHPQHRLRLRRHRRQRCTTTRRLIVHRSLMDKVFDTLKSAYLQSEPPKSAIRSTAAPSSGR